MKIYHWWQACRPKTLIVSIAPVALGVCLATHDGYFNLKVAITTLFSAIFIQIGTNLVNDLYDYLKGADTNERLGPKRILQSNLLSIEAVKTGIYLVFLIALILGSYLVYVGGYPILIIGSFALISSFCYTAGPLPLAYIGLGDIFVFIFFGIIAVPGTYYLQGGELWNLSSLMIGIPIGFLGVSILMVNNIRDVSLDEKVGKKTIVVRFGLVVSKVIFSLMLVLPFIAIFILFLFWDYHFPFALLLFLIPFAVKLMVDITYKHGSELNQVLINTINFLRMFSLILMIGLLL